MLARGQFFFLRFFFSFFLHSLTCFFSNNPEMCEAIYLSPLDPIPNPPTVVALPRAPPDLEIHSSPEVRSGTMGLFSSFDLEAESYPVYEDFIMLPFMVVFFPAARFVLDRFVFEGAARRLVLGKGHENLDTETKQRRKKLNKFKESAWKFVYFLSAQFLSLYVIYDEPWFKNTLYFWVGPGDQVWPDQKLKLELKGAYMYAAGFYTYSIFALIFWETKRHDWRVSMFHHVSTAILIMSSYIFRFARVGSVVLALHDACDVYLETGKMAKYSGCEPLAQLMFPLFVVAWVVFRLICFPFWVIRSTSYEVVLTLDKEKRKTDVHVPTYYYVFNTLLLSLLVLHIYWGFLMFRMLVNQIQSRGQIGDDVRSDSEGDDDDEHED